MTKKAVSTSMEGMIYNANAILEKAVSSKSTGISKKIVENCYGVAILSVVEVGAVFSGSVGSGIVLSHDPVAGTWSPPCACALEGIGFGLLMGGSHTDFITFVMDPSTMAAFMSERGHRFARQATAALGHFGRNENLNLNIMNKGAVTLSYTNGAFVGVSIENADVRPLGRANNVFYGRPTLSRDILAGDTLGVSEGKDILVGGTVKMPEGKVTLIDEVYKKLDILCKGETAEPDAAEQAKVEEAKKVTDTAGEEASKHDNVVEIDAKAEAAKGN